MCPVFGTPIAVVVADAQRLFAEALARALGEHADLDVSPRCPITGRDAVREAIDFKAQVVLVDYWITGMDGPASARAMTRSSPAVKVILLAEFHVGPRQLHDARSAGALGILPKSCAVSDVLAAARLAALGHGVGWGGIVARGDAATQERRRRLSMLTTREIEVLQLLRQGFAPKELANELSVTVGTVKNHIHRIMLKTGAPSRIAAINMAEEAGFISPTSRDLQAEPPTAEEAGGTGVGSSSAPEAR